jgi:hypothetical protein
MKNRLFYYLMFILLISCSNKLQAAAEVATVETKTEETAEDQSWSGFWEIFQKAVASGDKSKIAALTDFSALRQSDFDDAFEVFFSGEAKYKFGKAKVKDARKTEAQDFEGLKNAKNFMQLSFEEKGSDEEGNVYESALIYYFAKVNGKYKLVYLFAAG